ncbi:hypothetical protein LXL04_020590 [Taraxacum kok-saghyz]
MGKQDKQYKGAQREMNDYEKNRLSRIQENQAKLRDLGVKSIANSLTSLVESQNPKKKKVKTKYTSASAARDSDYNPGLGDDGDRDDQEVATSAKVSKKKHIPQYIAPNRLANLSKQRRVVAPNVSNKFPLESNAAKEKHARTSITMGELMLSNKCPQRKNEAFTQNVTKPNYINRQTKRKLYLVDEDDDDEDDEMPQDGFPADIEQYGFQDNVNEVGIVRSEDNVDPNDDFEDMDHVTFENEMEVDDSDDDLESDDDILFKEQLEGPQLENGTVISTSKKRGPTMLHDVHTRNAKQREVIICNEFGQPVGPVTENDVVGKFSRFLGTIARTHSYAPLTCASWHKVPHKDKIWEYVLGKYDVPDAAKTWVLKTIGHSYKVYKCRFKQKHFYQFNDNKTRWKNKPKCIPEQDFSTLLRSWNKKDVAKRCLRAKEIRMSLKNIHTAGPKSFARIRDEMKNEDPNHEFPTLTQMFETTRKRTDGRVYVDTYDDTARKLEQMKNYKPQEDESDVVDPYMVVMNKENDGYRRLYGRGVTNTLIKKVGGGDTSYMIPEALMESFKSNEVERNQLIEMKKEIQEDHEKKKAELEAMKLDINNQREKFEEMIRVFREQQALEGRNF